MWTIWLRWGWEITLSTVTYLSNNIIFIIYYYHCTCSAFRLRLKEKIAFDKPETVQRICSNNGYKMVLMLADVTLWKIFYDLSGVLSFYLVMMTESLYVKASN